MSNHLVVMPGTRGARLPLAELERRWVAAKQPMPGKPEIKPPDPIHGVYVGIDALKQLIAWGLLCRGIIGKGQDFDIIMHGAGIVVRPK